MQKIKSFLFDNNEQKFQKEQLESYLQNEGNFDFDQLKEVSLEPF